MKSCNDWEDNHKWKMRNKTKDGRLKKSQKHHSCLSNNHGTFEGSNVSKPTFQELDSFSCNNRNSNKMSNIPERDYLEHSDMNTERIKGNTAEHLQSKENPARVAESEENTSCMDIHNLEKAKLFWIKMQASRRVELVFEQLSNVITCLKKKISNGSANNQGQTRRCYLFSHHGTP